MSPELMWAVVGIAGIIVGLWLAKKAIKLALFLGVVAAALYLLAPLAGSF